MSVDYEKDTDDQETITNVFSLIYPKDILESNTKIFSFGMFYDERVFNGWVKQPSPCCGSASVAGVYNTLFHLHRNDSKAKNYKDITDIYITIIKKKLDKKELSFERKLGCTINNTKFWYEFLDLTIQNNKKLDGKKGNKITKKLMIKYIQQIIQNHYNNNKHLYINNNNNINDDEIKLINDLKSLTITKRTPYECFYELLLLDGWKPIDNNNNIDIKDDNDIDDEDDNDNDNDNDEDDDLQNLKNKKKKDWDWKDDFYDILRHKGGLLKLENPFVSTTFIGNWGLLECVPYLQEEIGSSYDFTARLFMGKKRLVKSVIDYPLSNKDNEDDIDTQWNGLKGAISDPKQALIFHITNHYALIFAYREWYELDSDNNPKKIRQILTARKGQRPTAWVDFTEMRSIMLGWEGYKVIAYTLKKN